MAQDNLTKKELKRLRREEKVAKKQQQAQAQSKNSWLLWLGVALGIVIILALIVRFAGVSPDSGNTVVDIDIKSNDQVRGGESASVVLVEYSDFQCPACAAYYPMMEQVHQEYGDRIKFIYRHFPLKQIHPNAQLAAQAAEAAGLQGKFWQMHDLLFENQMEWSDDRNPADRFATYASNLELNVDEFVTAMNSRQTADKVNADYREGLKDRVGSTPTFILNNVKIQNPRNYAELKQLIDDALVQAGE